jgi:hypothetical protein
VDGEEEELRRHGAEVHLVECPDGGEHLVGEGALPPVHLQPVLQPVLPLVLHRRGLKDLKDLKGLKDQQAHQHLEVELRHVGHNAFKILEWA